MYNFLSKKQGKTEKIRLFDRNFVMKKHVFHIALTFKLALFTASWDAEKHKGFALGI